MITTRPVKYQLEFCYPHTYASFVKAVKNRSSIARVGFIGVEHIRLFVSVVRGTVEAEPYIKRGNTWEVYTKRIHLDQPNAQLMLHSAQEYESELSRIFFRAFPRAEESFYDNMPAYKEVLGQLQGHPTFEGMESLRILYTVEDDSGVEDADGIVSILCDDGTLCIPYEDNKGVHELQLYRAKFHPDARLASAFNGAFDWLEEKWSRLSSITLGGVLNRIDSIVK